VRHRGVNTALRLALLLVIALAAVGCAHRAVAPAPVALSAAGPAEPAGDPASTAAEDEFALETPAKPAYDPLIGLNRVMFAFNDTFYFWLLKPVTKTYRSVVPRLARTGVENFFDNLRFPVRFVSDVVQLKGRAATIELGKFMINSTWGVLGFGNWFAGKEEMTLPSTDLGLALAHYGVGPGPYIVWPVLGPYTLRDTAGWAGGLTLDPVSYVNPLLLSLSGRTYSLVNYTSFRIGDYETIKQASIDPYLAMRDAYLQYRAEKAKK